MIRSNIRTKCSIYIHPILKSIQMTHHYLSFLFRQARSIQYRQFFCCKRTICIQESETLKAIILQSHINTLLQLLSITDTRMGRKLIHIDQQKHHRINLLTILFFLYIHYRNETYEKILIFKTQCSNFNIRIIFIPEKRYKPLVFLFIPFLTKRTANSHV